MQTDPGDVATSYDQVPYQSLPFPASHPGHLYTIARLFGVEAPAPNQCRVLELGCASGGNLIPMADTFPDGRYTGIDLSRRQIDDGLTLIRNLGLGNIELRTASVTDIDSGYGEFDYIIGHGLYSWVPAPVQDAVLAICRNHLADNGVAFLSYNTYPGWHINGMLREMMLFHASRFDDPGTKLQQARSLVEFVAAGLPSSHPYGSLLQNQLQELRKATDDYLFHEYLERDNQPVYFHEFISKAMGQGLQYLGDADFMTMFPVSFPPQVAATLQRIAPDQVSQEQYMDFLRNRSFRQTLLVHQEVTVSRSLDPDRARGLFVASPAKPRAERPDLSPDKPEPFQLPDRPAPLTVEHPLLKAAMLCLADTWPDALSFEELCSQARARLAARHPSIPDPRQSQQDATVLGAELQRLFAAQAVEFRGLPSAFTTQPGSHPLASPLARLQAGASLQLTNRRHEPVQVDELNRQLLLLLDGNRDRKAIKRAWIDQIIQLGVTIQQKGTPVREPARIRQILDNIFERSLSSLAMAGLLVR